MKKLSQRVARNLIQTIKFNEQKAGQEDTLLRCDNYLSLAHLYISEGLYGKAVSVLSRFIDLGRSEFADIPLVESKLNEARALLHEQRQIAALNKPVNTSIEAGLDSFLQSSPTRLALVGDVPEPRGVWQQLRDPMSRLAAEAKEIEKKPQLPAKPIKLVAMCAAYTGKTIQDEIYELAMVAFEYCLNNDRIIRTVDEYYGCRKTYCKLETVEHLRLAPELNSDITHRLSHEMVDRLIKDAHCVISHNDPYLERQHFFNLFPHLIDLEWRSSQLDIPWGAYGFKSKGLTSLLDYYGITHTTRTAKDRARGIMRLLGQVEPDADNTFLSRLLSCKPMRRFTWSPEARAQSNKLNRKRIWLPFVS